MVWMTSMRREAWLAVPRRVAMVEAAACSSSVWRPFRRVAMTEAAVGRHGVRDYMAARFDKAADLGQQHCTALILHPKMEPEVGGLLLDAQHRHCLRVQVTYVVVLSAHQESLVHLHFHPGSTKTALQHLMRHFHLAYLVTHAEVVDGGPAAALTSLAGNCHVQPVDPAQDQPNSCIQGLAVVNPGALDCRNGA